MPQHSRHGAIVSESGAAVAANPRLFYGYWIILAGFVTQFVSVGMANYVVGAFMIPMTEEFGWTRAEF